MNESDKQKKIAFKKYITIELMRDGYMSLDKVYGIAAQFNQKQMVLNHDKLSWKQKN